MSLLLDLKEVIKKNNKSLRKESSIKKYIKDKIKENELGSYDFVINFTSIAEQNNWEWFNKTINNESVIEHISNDVYRIIKAETNYFFTNGKWADRWVINSIGSGRIFVAPAEFESKTDHIWLEIDLFTTL